MHGYFARQHQSMTKYIFSSLRKWKMQKDSSSYDFKFNTTQSFGQFG